MDKVIVNMDTFLQIKLQRMTEEELDAFFDKHIVEYNGKLYSRDKEDVNKDEQPIAHI